MSKKNFTISTVATAPSPTTSGTSLVVATGHGTRFATGEPAVICPVNTSPDSTNSEIVTVSNVVGDTLTIVREQESTTARDIQVGDVVFQQISAKDYNDLLTLATHTNRSDLDNVSGTNSGDDASIPIGYLDTDGTLAGDSDVKVPTQKAVKAYVDGTKFVWKGAWVTSTVYVLNDVIEENGSAYICVTGHTSGTFATDLGAGKWELFVEGVGGNSIQVDSNGGTSDTYGTLSGLVNSSNTVYTVSLGSYISGSLRVYLNGQLQTQGSAEDWTETTPSSGTFTFATAPTTGDIIIVMYQFSSGATGNADTLDGVHLAGLLDLFYPIGTIYETTSTDLDTTTKMNAHFGGTWEAYGSGRVLVAKSADTEFDTIGETGGVKEVTLTSAQSGVPAHTHNVKPFNTGTGGGYVQNKTGSNTTSPLTRDDGVFLGITESNSTANASSAHTNLQPYIVVYRYRRTA